MSLSFILRVSFLAVMGIGLCATARAQQDTSDRLWQRSEQQAQQLTSPSGTNLRQGEQSDAYREALGALTQTPHDRLQQLLLDILDAINRRDWFGADRLLRQYERVPRHDPALFDFVTASRLAAEGQYHAAIPLYRQTLANNPYFARGNLDLAQVLYADNRLHDAQESFLQLREQQLPIEIQRYVDTYLAALEQRQRLQFSLTGAWVYEDNLNNASTVLDPCAIRLGNYCQPNIPGEKISDTGLYFEASANKLWALPGNHSLLFRSLNYGNNYHSKDDYNNLVSINYFGYQYNSARNQFQFLPSFEYDNEGCHKAYHAFGARTSFRRQLGDRAQLEFSYEYKDRHFASRLKNLQGGFRSATLFGVYWLQPSMQLYGSLTWRDNDALLKTFAYQERVARLGIYKSFSNQLTLNLSYAYRQRRADEGYFLFGKRQKDHENSVYVGITLPGYNWQGITPTLSYEYRDNRSNIAHAYNYQRNRITLGLSRTF